MLVTIGPAPSGEAAKQRQLEYDSLGHLHSVCEISSQAGTGACGQTIAQNGYLTMYTTNPLGNITTSVQGSNTAFPQTRTYVFDNLSRLTSETNPESGTTTYNYDSSTLCAASSPGDLIWKSDAAGNLTCYNYDALHRVTIASYGGTYQPATPNRYFVYDSAIVDSAAMANGGGRLVEAYSTTGTGKLTDLGFSYTKRGEVSDTYEMTPHSGGYFHLSASYFSNGQLNTFGSAGFPVSLTYNVDGEGRPWKINASTGQNPVTSTSYNTASQVTSVSYGSGDSDSFSFDPNTQLSTGYKLNVGSKSQTATITQNANHSMRQLAITDTIFGNENQTCVFTYDEFLRVTQDNCGSAWGANYAYDLFGNMAKSTIAGSPGTSFQPTYNTSNHYATIPGGTPSYDGDGNLLNDSFHRYTWDNEGNPVTLDGNSMTYDALNRRVEYYNSSVGYVQYLWAPYDATRNVLIVSSTGGQVQLPLPGGGQAMVGPAGVTEYRRANWQGSEPVDSSPSQTAIVDAAFTPYGEHYAENNYLGYFGGNLSIYPFFMDGYASTFRLYHYDQGRWISPDPAGLSAVDPTNPQTWNRYAYVAGNPLNNADPSGLQGISIIFNPPAAPPPAQITLPPQLAICGAIAFNNPAYAGLPLFVPCLAGATNSFPSPQTPQGTGVAGSNVTQFKRMPNTINCGSVLPNGRTVGSYVNQISNTINNAAQVTSTPYGPSVSYSPGESPLSIPGQVYSETNFRGMFGKGAGYTTNAFLGDAGNFAYAAVSANIGVPYLATELVAAEYSWTHHPMSDWVGPYGMDPSATAQIPAGYGASCKGY